MPDFYFNPQSDELYHLGTNSGESFYFNPEPDELYHFKYLAKIGKGINARYFYTKEEIEAYKKALSSKDEKARMDKSQKQYDKTSKAAAKANKQYERASQKAAVAKSKLIKADSEYKEAYSQREESQRINKNSIKGRIDSASKEKGLKNKANELVTGEKYKKPYAEKERKAQEKFINSAKNVVRANKKKTEAEVNADDRNSENNKARKKYEKAERDYDDVTKLGGRTKALSKELDKHGHKKMAKGASKVSKILSKVGNKKISDFRSTRKTKILDTNSNEYQYDQITTRTKKTVNDVLQGKTGEITTNHKKGTGERFNNGRGGTSSIETIDYDVTSTQSSTRKKKKKK